MVNVKILKSLAVFLKIQLVPVSIVHHYIPYLVDSVSKIYLAACNIHPLISVLFVIRNILCWMGIVSRTRSLLVQIVSCHGLKILVEIVPFLDVEAILNLDVHNVKMDLDFYLMAHVYLVLLSVVISILLMVHVYLV
jgi:hypothetical protein